MIYTITFNPALDYIVSVENFQLGMTNRTVDELVLPGGKGINVSVVLKNLGYESTALGFIAGFTGEEIRRRVEEIGCVADFIRIPEGMSRINMKLKSMDGTEINGMGPNIDSHSLEKLQQQLEVLKSGDILILAGSIPSCLPDTVYKDIMERMKYKEILTVVDATGERLVNVLENRPFLIKPNNHELGEIFNVVLKRRDEVAPYAKEMQKLGARNVLVSMAGEGAVLVDETGGIHESPAPKGKLINAVGAGDSMVAGFLAGWLETGDYRHAFRMGVASGSASAFSENLATREEIEKVLKQVLTDEKVK